MKEKTKVRLIAASIVVSSLIGGAFLVASMLNGCDGKTTSKTKEYFEAHIDEAKQTTEDCKKLAVRNEMQPAECAAAKTVTFFHSGKKPIKGDEKDIKTW